MTAPRLSATGITVRFGGVTALDGVDLEVPAASTVGLVGPNGAGKSTLFSVLSGLRRPHAGQVCLDGVDVTKASPQARARRGLARTFQHPELFSGLTVREHVTLAYRLKHSPLRVWTDPLTAGGFRRAGADEQARVDQLLQGLHLDDVAHRLVGGLPLGTARLVEIARALAREPSVLLLDEASSGLDAAETEELAEVLRRVVAERGVSVLMVEHDVDLVLRLSDFVCVLDFGVRIAHGTPAQIRTDAAVRAAYLGKEVAQ
jgi:branched-chain amino acid transport system ATP-binding protein